MHRPRVKGLVRLANQVQETLAQPVSLELRDRLHRQVCASLQSITNGLSEHGLSVNALPGPSKRAFRFLEQVDWKSVAVSRDGACSVSRPVRIPGITRWTQQYAATISRNLGNEPRLREVHQEVATLLNSGGPTPELLSRLNSQSQQHLSWILLLSQETFFTMYVSATRTLLAALRPIAERRDWPLPLEIHFRPTKSIYRMAPADPGIHIQLPTPMIGLAREQFDQLAQCILGRKSKKHSRMLHELTVSERYLEIVAELDGLVARPEQTSGMIHSLDDAFERVNNQYFQGAMAKPKLVWNSSLTLRKFGHYNFSTDTVMLSRTLDAAQVPKFVVDHVMHHELLHKKHGIQWHNGKSCFHTQAFRNEERTFEHYEQADQFLQNFVKSMEHQ